ncbi:MAG: ACT domain-containing protein [Eggerthellaceae bacterium]
MGRNQVGILAGVSSVLANLGASIDDISQDVADSSFSMSIVVRFENREVDLTAVKQFLADAGKDLGVKINLFSASI